MLEAEEDEDEEGVEAEAEAKEGGGGGVYQEEPSIGFSLPLCIYTRFNFGVRPIDIRIRVIIY